MSFQVASPVQHGFTTPAEAHTAICFLQAPPAACMRRADLVLPMEPPRELGRLCTGQAALLGDLSSCRLKKDIKVGYLLC